MDFEPYIEQLLGCGIRCPDTLVLKADKDFELNYGAFVYIALKTDSIDWMLPAWREYQQSDSRKTDIQH